jgi:hypothetical protein
MEIIHLIARLFHDVAKEAAEHEEHLTHVLHQLQNKPHAAFFVVCFSYSSNGVLALCYSTGGTSGLVSSFV